MRGVTEVTDRPNPEKPLEELTHQDIMQLTREDCRRYLKEKGMRRPSWNKSQAIQQVLSLKNLFDSTLDDHTKSGKENEEEPSFLVPSLDAASNTERPKLGWLGDAELPVLASHPPSISGENVLLHSPSAKQSRAQLTIFYCGNVNVYNDVPAEKAQAIMLLAGAPNHLPSPSPLPLPLPLPLPFPSSNGVRCVSSTIGSSTQIHKESPITRKASLQRFLEKKKDRSRCKTSAGASKKPPMLMGMFMHPSYWSAPAKNKATKYSARASPTRPPQTPSSDEQALKSVIEISSEDVVDRG